MKRVVADVLARVSAKLSMVQPDLKPEPGNGRADRSSTPPGGRAGRLHYAGTNEAGRHVAERAHRISARRIAMLCIAAVLTASCGVTRHIPEGSYMLRNNVVKPDRGVPARERISAGELDRYLLQSPNRHFLGTNLYPWLYSQADPTKTSWWHGFLRGMGEEPVVWEPAKTDGSVENLRTYIASRGFFSDKVGARIDTLRRRRVRITYGVTQGPASYIGRIGRTFRDMTLISAVAVGDTETLLHTGDRFDTRTMNNERVRVAAMLRDRGYYDFNPGHISYLADSTASKAGSGAIDVEMIVRRNTVGYSPDGAPLYADHRPYRIGRIDVHSDYDPLRSGGAVDADTLSVSGLDIIYHGRQRVWARLLRRAIRLRTDSLYSASDVAATSSELMRLGAYRSVSVLFYKEGDGVLNCDIRCVPAMRQSIGLDAEGSLTSSFWGLRTTVSYKNRNLFRGAELFDASVSSGFEFLRSGPRRLSYELNGNASLTFPRFVFWGAERSRGVRNPVSTLTLSAGWQDRAYYSRTMVGAGWGYGWSTRRGGNFKLNPVDISIVDMGYMSDAFTTMLNNPYLVASYNDQLIAGISGAYTLGEHASRGGAGRTLRIGVETTGNLISGLVRLADGEKITRDAPVAEAQPPRKESHYNIFGIRFAQYLRGEVSFSQTFGLGEKTFLAYRVLGGAVYAYGNSTSPPFEKFFFAGGAGSMRGWTVRTLGPGTVPYTKSSYPAQIGDVKFEANVELRFPVVRSLGGALFMDAGNVWFMHSRPTEYPDEAVFRLDRFYRQLGLDGGVGVRLDIWRVLLRLDWGLQLHSPGRPHGERWIHNFRWENTAFSLGVGHAF